MGRQQERFRGTCSSCLKPSEMTSQRVISSHRVAIRVGKEWLKESCPGVGLAGLCSCSEHDVTDRGRMGRVGARWVRCDVLS